MDGIQKTLKEEISCILGNICSGKYGEDDNIDMEALREDIDEIIDQF